MVKKKLVFFGLICSSILFIICSKAETTSYEYIGSTTCKVCHPTKYNSWKETEHSKMMRLPTSETVIGDFTQDPTLSLSGGTTITINLNYDSATGEYTATLGIPPATSTYKVEYVLGSKWKQGYLVKIGDCYYKLGFKWSAATNKWFAKDIDEWYNTDGSTKTFGTDKAWGKRCAGCHTTGYTPLTVSSGTFKEMGIGCESCHGPGKTHQDTCRQCHLGKEGKKSEKMGDPKIVHPGKLSVERSAEICGYCHSRGNSKPNKSFGYPWKDDQSFTDERLGAFLPGNTLSDYLIETPTSDTSRWWQDSPIFTEQGHHQQWQGWGRSKHEDYSISCVSCHNPHGSTYGRMTKLNAQDNELCYSCHPSKKKGVHSRHKSTGMGSHCIECHMVKTVKSADWFGVSEWKRGDIRSHTFKFIEPANYGKYGMPNSCTSNSCHDGTHAVAVKKDTATATTDLATLKTSRVFPADPLNVVVYPNPFKIKEARDGVLVFANLPEGSKVKIYTLSGKLVAEIIAGTENCAFWDGKNEDKEECARGIYIFIVESPDGKKQTGKFTLIKQCFVTQVKV